MFVSPPRRWQRFVPRCGGPPLGEGGGGQASSVLAWGLAWEFRPSHWHMGRLLASTTLDIWLGLVGLIRGDLCLSGSQHLLAFVAKGLVEANGSGMAHLHRKSRGSPGALRMFHSSLTASCSQTLITWKSSHACFNAGGCDPLKLSVMAPRVCLSSRPSYCNWHHPDEQLKRGQRDNRPDKPHTKLSLIAFFVAEPPAFSEAPRTWFLEGLKLLCLGML